MMSRTWIILSNYVAAVIAVLWTLAPAWCEQITVFSEGAVVGGRNLDGLVADSQTITTWPSAPGLNQAGAAYLAERPVDGKSRQAIPADTGIFVLLFGSGEWESPQDCFGPNWDPLPDAIATLDQRLLNHDERMWLNGAPIEFDWADARVDLALNALLPPDPAPTGPCIESNGDLPIERRSAISGMFGYIPPSEPGEYVLEYFSPGFGKYTRTFVVQDGLIGDLDRSGALDAADIDMISSGIRESSVDLVFDRDRNGIVNADDRDSWFDTAGISLGDADLSGTVDFSDFLALSAAFDSESGWTDGDFDGDGAVGFPDFLLLSQNFGTRTIAASVPEPEAIWPTLLITLGMAGIRRRRKMLFTERSY